MVVAELRRLLFEAGLGVVELQNDRALLRFRDHRNGRGVGRLVGKVVARPLLFCVHVVDQLRKPGVQKVGLTFLHQ